jgi:hypothetical protein
MPLFLLEVQKRCAWLLRHVRRCCAWHRRILGWQLVDAFEQHLCQPRDSFGARPVLGFGEAPGDVISEKELSRI